MSAWTKLKLADVCDYVDYSHTASATTTNYAKLIQHPPETVFASYLVRFRVNSNNDKEFVGIVVQSDIYKKFISNNLGGAVFWADSDFWPMDIVVYFVKTKLSLVFTFHLLKTQSFILGGAAVPGLNREQAYRNLILIPPSDLISAYALKVEPLQLLIYNLQMKNSNLSKASNLLIPQLVTGKRELKEQYAIY